MILGLGQNLQNENGVSCKARSKEVLKKQKDGSIVKGQRGQLKELPTVKVGTV